jgi:FAD synthase
MELVFLKKLREEQKFAALPALRAQILEDIARARALCGEV